MGCSRIAAFGGFIIWAVITLMGVGLMQGDVAQHIAGYPSAGQLQYYVYFPALMSSAALGIFALMTWRRTSSVTKKIAAGATVLVWLMIPVFMFPYTGGM